MFTSTPTTDTACESGVAFLYQSLIFASSWDARWLRRIAANIANSRSCCTAKRPRNHGRKNLVASDRSASPPPWSVELDRGAQPGATRAAGSYPPPASAHAPSAAIAQCSSRATISRWQKCVRHPQVHGGRLVPSAARPLLGPFAGHLTAFLTEQLAGSLIALRGLCRVSDHASPYRDGVTRPTER
jgi:hypothetical protein